MKKALGILSLAALAVLITSMPVSAADDNRNVTVSAEIAPAYIVTIPMNTRIYFNVEDTDFGTIELSKAQLEPQKCVRVTLLTDNLLENKSDVEKVLPFAVFDGEQEFHSAKYTAVGDKTSLTIHIDRDDWNRAYAGEYEDTVTFQIEYTDK